MHNISKRSKCEKENTFCLFLLLPLHLLCLILMRQRWESKHTCIQGRLVFLQTFSKGPGLSSVEKELRWPLLASKMNSFWELAIVWSNWFISYLFAIFSAVNMYYCHLFDLWETDVFWWVTRFQSAALAPLCCALSQTCTSLPSQTETPDINKWTVAYCVGWCVLETRGLGLSTQLQSGSYLSAVVLWRAQLIFQGHAETHSGRDTPELWTPSPSASFIAAD